MFGHDSPAKASSPMEFAGVEFAGVEALAGKSSAESAGLPALAGKSGGICWSGGFSR